MRKQRARALKELYEVTQEISKPEITPVLEGSCRIQGPGDEVDVDFETNLALLQTEKGFGKHYLNEDIPMKASGTCNVCAAPCSSCMHFNRAVSFMESKAEGGTSENSCGRKEADDFSFSNSEMPPFYKSKPCDDRMQEASETSKMFSTTSSHDSYSENAESKGPVKTSDVEGVDMPLRLTSSETVEENQLLVEHNINSQSSKEPGDPSVVHRTLSNHQGDPRGLECHDDNLSCVTSLRDVNVAASGLSTNLGGKNVPCTSASTGALHCQSFKMAAQAQAADGDIVDVQVTLQRSGKFTKEFSQTKGSSSDPSTGGFSHNNSDSPSLNGEPSPKEQSLNSKSKIESSLNTNVGSKDAGENSSAQLQAQPSESDITVNPDCENGKTSSIPIDASLPRATYRCSETEIRRDDSYPTDDSIKHGMPNKQHGKTTSSLEAFNIQGPRPILEGDSPDTETLEDDVKVCDICGDAGREDLLAICSRCSDGAEHIYCMRIMLDKVPEGDWLCEECKLKDATTDKMEKSETISGTLKAPCFNEKVQKVGSSFNPKLLPKLDISTIHAEGPLTVKGLQSPQISAKRPSGNADITSLSNKKHSETSVAAVLTASPSRKSMLSRESSFKNLDAGKAKHGNFASSGSQSSPSSQAFLRSLAPGPNSSRIQGQLQGPWGSLSRSGSFNTLKPKVKQVTESVSQKPQVTKENATSDTKDGFMRTLSKSASFKNINSGHSNVVESTTKSQSIISLQRPEEFRSPQQSKERTMERKNSFVVNRTTSNSSPASTASVSLSKSESKTMQNDWKVNNLPEPNVSHLNKVSEDSHDKGVKELRKQESQASKAFGNLPSNGACNSIDQRPTQVPTREDAHVISSGDINSVPQRILNPCNRDEKSKDSPLLGSSRSLVLQSKRILRCQRCNETGHSTQFCSIDKLRVSALKPSAERSSREATNKSNKWKDVVDAAISKSRMQKNLPNQSEEILSIDMGSEIVSQNHSPSSSSCVKDLPSAEGTTDKQSSLRNSTAGINKVAVNDVKQHAPEMIGAVCTSKDGESNAFSNHREELKANPSMHILPEHHSVLSDPLRVSALPHHEYIWQGSFEVKKAGKLSELCDGVQAHLSSCASPKVLKVANKFPDKVQLEEVARLSSWPLQFQENCPTEENIALFFFAKDVASYEKSYSKLLENMLQNDLALKGNIDGIELLIFSSSKLPKKSQRWNRLLFLWAVFREKRLNSSETSFGPQNRTSRSNYHSEHNIHSLTIQPVAKIVASEKESSQEDMNKDISRHDKSDTQANDLKSTSFLGVESRLSYVDKSSCQRTSIQEAIDQGAVDSELHPDKNTSNPVGATDLLTSERTASCDIFAEARIQERTAQLCLEVKNSGSTNTCQKEFTVGSDGRKVDNLPIVQNSSNSSRPTVHSHAAHGLSAMHIITSDPGPPDLNVDSLDVVDVYSEPILNHQLSSFPVRAGVVGSKDEEMMNTGRLEKGTASDSAITADKSEDMRWLSGLPNMKHARSHSPENISQSSGGTSVGTSAETLWRRRTECTSVDEERESKKIKVEVPACSSSAVDSFGGRSSSKVHPLLGSFLNEQLHPDNIHSLPTLPESSGDSERHFFPLDSNSVMDTRTGSLIPLQILSSDDEFEHQQELDAPNLELALGAEKRPVKQEIQPLPFPLVSKSKNRGKLPIAATEDADDESASLSLSLAFPFSGKKQVQMPVPKTEQLLPKRSQVNTSFLSLR